MCHGMGLTASAVGERITLVWSLTEPQWGLDLTSLSRLFGALQVQMGRCQRQPTDAAPCSYGCCWWHSAGTRDHECQRHSASGSAVAAAWTAAQSKAAARQPRSDSTAYIDTPAPAFKSAAPTPQARLLASSRCLLVAAAPTAARRRLHRTAASTRPPMCPQSCTYGCTTRPPMHRRLHRTAAPTAAPTRPPMLPQSCS